MTIWFTSDQHWGHGKIIQHCSRPFIDVDEMNQQLITRWNSVVQRGDTVYHLGDMFYRCAVDDARQIIACLNGKINLVLGNHDGIAQQLRPHFGWIKEYYELNVEDADALQGKQRIILMHYPLLSWRGSGRSTWSLFGHEHGLFTQHAAHAEDMLRQEEDGFEMLAPIEMIRHIVARNHMLDVGVDVNDFRPISYEEVKARMAYKDEQCQIRKQEIK